MEQNLQELRQCIRAIREDFGDAAAESVFSRKLLSELAGSRNIPQDVLEQAWLRLDRYLFREGRDCIALDLLKDARGGEHIYADLSRIYVRRSYELLAEHGLIDFCPRYRDGDVSITEAGREYLSECPRCSCHSKV